ncbi:MAG: sulfatase-like hydrolase/transferase [Pelomonas sp.]|nr:sulfatase-like hydrolase/transferase [Roseateles sp.]
MPAARPDRLLRALPPPRSALLAAVVFLLWTVVGATWFLRTYLGPVTLDQVLFHLHNGGLDYADPRMIRRACRCLLVVLALTVISLFLLRRMRRWHGRALLALLGTGAVVSVNATVSDPCQPEPGGGDYLARHYVDPRRAGVQPPAVKPDVLVVFVESLDEAYTRTRRPEAALLPALTQLQDDFQTLGELHNLSGASWTVGGMFTALCGVPLQRVGLMSHNSLEYSRRFFAGGRCLTDLMADAGWEISFYGGASLQFAGKGRFLQEHGVARRFGAQEWRAMGVAVPTAGWGLLDSDLTQLAWADMQRPRTGDAARMSVLLTVDTHGPSGAHDGGCANPADLDDTDEDDAPAEIMRGALRCTDRVVAQLVQRFLAQRDGRPKVVWVQGDHLNPEPLLDAELQPRPQGRTVFHALARFDAEGRVLPGPDQQRVFSHVDILPTLAEAIGLRWTAPEHRLGLGVSLLGGTGPRTLAEQVGMRTLDARLSCRSPLFQRLWLNAT